MQDLCPKKKNRNKATIRFLSPFIMKCKGRKKFKLLMIKLFFVVFRTKINGCGMTERITQALQDLHHLKIPCFLELILLILGHYAMHGISKKLFCIFYHHSFSIILNNSFDILLIIDVINDQMSSCWKKTSRLNWMNYVLIIVIYSVVSTKTLVQ
mgnify:CR=1 FL=1